MLLTRALQGNTAAARLVLEYVAGKPGAAPGPDTLDAEEIAVLRRYAIKQEDIDAVLRMFPAWILCHAAQTAGPIIQEKLALELYERLQAEPNATCDQKATRNDGDR